MSFIIPGESEQIALIEHMEAESVPATPFAFSVPQEDMDDILRTGGNTTNHRLILAAEFSKGKPVEEMARILQQVYHGGNGMATEHGRISAWYAENGIRFAASRLAIPGLRRSCPGRMPQGASRSCWKAVSS